MPQHKNWKGLKSWITMIVWMCPKMKFQEFVYEHLQCINHYISELSVYSEKCITTFINIFCGTTLIWWCFWKTWLWLSTYNIIYHQTSDYMQMVFSKSRTFLCCLPNCHIEKNWMCFNVVYLIFLYVKVFFFVLLRYDYQPNHSNIWADVSAVFFWSVYVFCL